MKGFRLLALFLFVSATLMSLCHSIHDGMAITRHGSDVTVATSSRKLKQKSNNEMINLEDYDSIDPVPSSMNSIRPGPIQHAAPLLPYIPTTPPSPPGPDLPNPSDFP